MAEILKKDFQLFFSRVRTQSPCGSRDLAPLTQDTIFFHLPVAIHCKQVSCQNILTVFLDQFSNQYNLKAGN